MVYREYRKEDYQAVGNLALQLINHVGALDRMHLIECKEGYVEAYWKKLEEVISKHTTKFFVVEKGNEVIAYCVIVVELKEEISGFEFRDIKEISVGDIYDICVDEKYRGMGIGSCLLKMAEGWMKEVGCQYSWLQVMEDNEQAVNLYKKMGYEKRVVSMMKKLVN